MIGTGYFDALEEFLKNPGRGPKVPIFAAQISMDIGQKEDGSFNEDEASLKKSLLKEFPQMEDYKFEKIKWGPHPVLHLCTKVDGERLNSTWIGH